MSIEQRELRRPAGTDDTLRELDDQVSLGLTTADENDLNDDKH